MWKATAINAVLSTVNSAAHVTASAIGPLDPRVRPIGSGTRAWKITEATPAARPMAAALNTRLYITVARTRIWSRNWSGRGASNA